MSAVKRRQRPEYDELSRKGALLGVAEELIARWSVVKQALEKFGEEVGR